MIKDIKMIKNLKVLMMSLIVFLAMLGGVFAEDTAIIDVNLMSQDPDPVIAGDVVELRFSVENIGLGTSDSLTVELDSEYPFEVVGESSYEIGSLMSGQNDENKQIVKFKVKVDKDTPAGSEKISLKVFEGSSGSDSDLSRDYDFYVDVKSKDSAEIVSIDKTVLIPGQMENVTFKIANMGSSNLKDLTFSWKNADKVILSVGSDNSVYIKSLDVGEVEEITFTVVASSIADADLYQLDLKLSYEDSISGSVNEVSTTAGIYVGGGSDFDVVFSEVSDGEYAFTVSNIGSNDASSVTVNVPSSDGWSAIGRNSEIIGNLNKGDYTTVTFDLQNTRNAGDLLLDIDYTDTMGNRLTIDKSVIIPTDSDSSMNVTSRPTGTISGDKNSGGMRGMTSGVNTLVSLSKYGGIVIVLLIAGFVGFRIYRKKKNNKGSRR